MTLFLNGTLNAGDPFIHQPTYLWALALWWFVIMPVAWFLLKKLKWDPFSRFHGLHYAKKNDSAACLITDDTGDTHMVAEHIAKCIFSYGDDDYEIEIPDLPLHTIKIAGIVAAILGIIVLLSGQWIGGIVIILLFGLPLYFMERLAPWIYGRIFWYPTKYLKDIDWQKALLYKIGHVNYDCKIAQHLQGGEWDQYPVVNAGGIPVEWIFDSDHWCERKTPQHKAVVASARAWNKENPEDQVHTYTKYQRYLNEGKIIAPPEIRKDYLVPWVRIDLGYSFSLRNVDWGGKLRQMAKNKGNKPQALIDKYFLPLLLGGVGMFFGELIIRIVFLVLFGKAPVK